MDNAIEQHNLHRFTLIEIMYLCFYVKDCLDFCYNAPLVSKEAYENRAKGVFTLLDENHFLYKYLNNYPNEQGKKFYDALINLFNNVYTNHNFVDQNTLLVVDEKKLDLVEETIRCYQSSFDILQSFQRAYEETGEDTDVEIKNAIVASEELFRVCFSAITYKEVIKEDQEFRKSFKLTQDINAYETKFSFNILKRYLSAIKFNMDKGEYLSQETKQVLNEVYITFQKMDGTLKVTPQEILDSVNNSSKIIGEALKRVELNFQQKYYELSVFRKNIRLEKEQPEAGQA